jgi:hypothetical protein
VLYSSLIHASKKIIALNRKFLRHRNLIYNFTNMNFWLIILFFSF